MEGWIKLHRKIQNNWLWKEKRKFSKFEAWISLLLKANHRENKILVGGDLIVIKAGSFITSEVNLSEEWNWSRNTVRKFLKVLENEKMLTKSCTTKYTSISIENWALYQSYEQDFEQQIEQQSEQQKDIKMNTNKNEKNDKNEKNIKKEKKENQKTEFDLLINESNYSNELKEVLYDFIKMRKSIKKPMTTRAVTMLINKLNNMAKTEEEKIKILNNSIFKNWQDIYPLKEEKQISDKEETKEERIKRLMEKAERAKKIYGG